MKTHLWKCGRFDLLLDRPLVMGILNVTPDSFSDGGLYPGPLEAVEHAQRMAAAGAGMIDVGGESTRPGAAPVETEEELARVLPVVTRLSAGDLPVSIDTRHAAVAQACVAEGASVINDVTGFRDPEMVRVASECDAGLVVMHMRGDDPATMQRAPRYSDVVAEVATYLCGQAEALEAAGVAPERIAVDPGIGFGKTFEHNIELLGRLSEIAALGYPVLVGASRKAFIGHILGRDDPGERVWGSVGAAVAAFLRGADVVRVHDVEETSQALSVAATIGR